MPEFSSDDFQNSLKRVAPEAVKQVSEAQLRACCDTLPGVVAAERSNASSRGK